ncbi:MAG: hypothetical protein IID41_09255 [Planctomycetes bacterium]|nr:hypothetical protein [Planctomycetota bacterium]
MEVTPKSEAEVQPQVLASGIYDAFVRTAKDQISKADNDMIELKLAVSDRQGNQVIVTDYLLDAMEFKLRHFCFAAGLGDAYNAGELTAELCQEQNVRVKLRIEGGNGEYLRKNRVIDYLAPADTAAGTADDVAPDAADAADAASPAPTPEASQPESAQPSELAKVPF